MSCAKSVVFDVVFLLCQRIQDLVVPLCVRLQQQAHCLQEVGAISGQYGSPSPRRELYRVLLALVLVPSPRWPPPLSCAVSIFSHGRRDRNIKVRKQHAWSQLRVEYVSLVVLTGSVHNFKISCVGCWNVNI